MQGRPRFRVSQRKRRNLELVNSFCATREGTRTRPAFEIPATLRGKNRNSFGDLLNDCAPVMRVLIRAAKITD